MFEQGGGNGGEDKKWKDEKICTPTKNPPPPFPPPPMHTHTVSSTKMGSPTNTFPPPKNITWLLRSSLLWEMMGGKLHNRLGSYDVCICMSPGKRLRGHVRMIHGGWEMEEGWALSPICNVQVHVQHRPLAYAGGRMLFSQLVTLHGI